MLSQEKDFQSTIQFVFPIKMWYNYISLAQRGSNKIKHRIEFGNLNSWYTSPKDLRNGSFLWYVCIMLDGKNKFYYME